MPDGAELAMARRHLQIAAELSPRNVRYRSAYGEALLAAGDLAGALAEFTAAADLEPGARNEALQAFVALKLGRTSTAFALVDRALRAHGAFALGHYVRGLCRVVEGDPVGAAADFAAAADVAWNGAFFLEERARLADPAAGPLGLAPELPAEVLKRFLRGAATLKRAETASAERA
ncbi:MAG TPA: hypothetical protein VEI02_03105 [Planctomycetota bacterium]|nr:hypothetical protein [Planctomycetota bacterium]